MKQKTIIFMVLLCIMYSMSVPDIVFNRSITSYSYSSYPVSTCKEMKITQTTISRLGGNNVVQIYNKTTYETFKILLNYTNPQTQDQFISTHLIIPNHNLVMITVQGQMYSLFLSNFEEFYDSEDKPHFNLMSVDNKIFGTTIVGNAVTSNIQQLQSYQINSNNSKLKKLKINMIFNMSIDLKLSYSQDKTIFALLKPNFDILIYKFINNHTSLTLFGSITNNNTIQNLTQSISFSKDNKFVILQMDIQQPVRIFSLNSSSLPVVKSFNYNGTINKAMFLDSYNNYIALFNDTSIIIYDYATLTLQKIQNLQINSNIIEIDYNEKILFICQNQTIQIHNIIDNPVSCSQYCQVCENSTYCNVCIVGYNLINNACSNNTTNSSSNQTSNQNDTSSSNFTNSTSNQTNNQNVTQNNQNHQNNHMVMVLPDGTIQILQISQTQKNMIDSTKSGLTYSNKILENLMLLFSTIPFIYFFLSSLNFFSICSLYVYLNVSMPNELYEILKTIQSSMNNNLLSLLGLNINFSDIAEQKITNPKYLQLGLSSNYLSTNYYSIINFFFILIILFLMKKCSNYTDKEGLLYRILNQQYSDFIFGTILSCISQIILPYQSVLWNISFTKFSSKLNYFLQTWFIGLILPFIGYMIAFLAVEGQKNSRTRKTKSSYNKTPNNLQQKQKKQKNCQSAGYIAIIKQRQSIYFGFNNLIFAALVTINHPIYFLIVGQLFTLIGIKKALSYRNWRLNRIILSLYPIIFHACFIIFYFNPNSIIIVWALIVCLLTYFIGSMHELLTIVVQLFNFLWRYMIDIKQRNTKIHNDDNNHKKQTDVKHQQKILQIMDRNIFQKNESQLIQSKQPLRSESNKSKMQKKPIKIKTARQVSTARYITQHNVLQVTKTQRIVNFRIIPGKNEEIDDIKINKSNRNNDN